MYRVKIIINMFSVFKNFVPQFPFCTKFKIKYIVKQRNSKIMENNLSKSTKLVKSHASSNFNIWKSESRGSLVQGKSALHSDFTDTEWTLSQQQCIRSHTFIRKKCIHTMYTSYFKSCRPKFKYNTARLHQNLISKVLGP